MNFDRHRLAAIVWAERPETERAPRRQLRLCLDALHKLPTSYSLTSSQSKRLRFAIRRLNHLITINRRNAAHQSRLRGRRGHGPLDQQLDL